MLHFTVLFSGVICFIAGYTMAEIKHRKGISNERLKGILKRLDEAGA
jgi:hypothetical protein